MDIDGLERLLTSIERNEKNLFARDVIEASPLSQKYSTHYAYLDDAPLERRTRAVFQRRWLDPETAADMGKLDQAAIDRVREEVGRSRAMLTSFTMHSLSSVSKTKLRAQVGRSSLPS